MYRKNCPQCKGDSYSASSGKWICPYCRADLSSQKFFPAVSEPEAAVGQHGEVKILPLKPKKRQR